MKKFLSLVLALVMTMSLVTIGAGATEYKDLTDKGEIQYEEAVAVLNKLGIITGYEDGSFKPTGALTRGAAAKIIVSLMIGSQAASSLTVAAAPYSDVPVTNTFAGVISYCKTAGYISGYADGTFRPTGALTGYAFSKMLLGALGYDGAVEGFTGSGWTMNVAKIGNKAGLFNRLDFVGNDGVSREAACQLALNTLKATKVEYTGNTVNVSGKDINVSVGNNKYEFSNNSSSTDGNIESDTYMQFAEEHFKDLKRVNIGSAADDFDRPANQWTYKNVTIGNFAKTADFTYTKSMVSSTDTASVKESKMGLKGYSLDSGSVTPSFNGKAGTAITSVAALAGLTKDGRLVEVYVDDDDADTITDVVVVDTVVAQITKVASDKVTVKSVSDATELNSKTMDADEDSVGYADLSGMKKDDYVLVIPVTTDDTTYDVYKAWAPVTVTGALTKVSVNKDYTGSEAVTVAGTKYSNAYNCDASLKSLNSTSLTALTKKDITIFVDQYGYAIYGKEVTASSEFMMVTGIKSTVASDGTATKSVTGIGTDGETVTLNVGDEAKISDGTGYTSALTVGTVYKYEPASTAMSNTYSADYMLSQPANDNDGAQGSGDEAIFLSATPAGAVYTANVSVGDTGMAIDGAVGAAVVPYASDVKFVYYDSSDGSTSVKTGIQKVTVTGSTTAVGVLGEKNGVTRVVAVFVAGTPEDLLGSNVMYVERFLSTGTDSTGKTTFIYQAYIDGEKTEIESKINVGTTNVKKICTYSKDANDLYTLSVKADNDGLGKATNFFMGAPVLDVNATTKQIKVTGVNLVSGVENWVWANTATVIDVDGNNAISSGSLDDIADLIANNTVKVTVIFNDNSTVVGYNTISYIFVESVVSSDASLTSVKYDGAAQTISGLTLPAMTVANGTSTAVVLTPAAGATVTSIVSGTPADATVSASSGNTFNVTWVQAGTSTVTIIVTAADGVTTQNYTIAVTTGV